jgi:hypothetical protein
MDQKLSFVSFEPRMEGSYREFAEACFGAGAYQASPRYLRWLYQANDASPGFQDCPVGIAGDRVVGCIHKMTLPWVIGGVPCRVPTLHNLMVEKQYRAGAGFWLLKRSLHRERHAIIPGVLPPLSEAYDQMNCERVASRWFRKVLRPVAGGWSLVRSRLTGTLGRHRYLADSSQAISGCRLTIQPTPERLAGIAEELKGQEGPDHVDWTEPRVQWRFFHELGPRHALVEFEESRTAFALVSLGPRAGLIAGRLIALSAEAAALGVGSIRRVCRLLASCGAHAMLATTANDEVAALLRAARFREYPISPQTYFYHRDKQVIQKTVFGPDISDIGFEAIRP